MTNGFIEAAYLSKSVHTDVTAGTTTYVVSFAGGMQPTDDIEVWVNGIKATSATVTWLSDSTLQLNGYTPVEGDNIEFRRVSPKDDNLVDLEAGKTIRAVSLMKNFRHTLQVAQEAWDKSDADSAAAEAAAYAAEAAISADIIEPTKFAYNVDSVEALRLTPATEYTTVYLRGHTSVGDGGHGTFCWDITSTDADDGQDTIAVTGVSIGRWKRNIDPITGELSTHINRTTVHGSTDAPTSGSIVQRDFYGCSSFAPATEQSHAVVLGQLAAIIMNQIVSSFDGDLSGTNSGWLKLPGGMIIQWGKNITASTEDIWIVHNFPIPFPTTAFVIVGTGTDAIGTLDPDIRINIYGLSQFRIWNTGYASKYVNWIALGYDASTQVS